MSKINISEHRQKKERGVSVKELLEDTLAEADEIDSLVLVAKNNDKEILIGFSTESNMEAIGFLEVAKNEIMYNESD